MGSAIDLTLDLIESRKQTYKANGTPYFRPWIFLVTDGEPTDGNRWQEAARRVQSTDRRRRGGRQLAGRTVGDLKPAPALRICQRNGSAHCGERARSGSSPGLVGAGPVVGSVQRRTQQRFIDRLHSAAKLQF
jgi:hypothetical protein